MDVPSPGPEPRPGSAVWSSTPAAARWRAAQPVPVANYVGPLVEPLAYPTFLIALRPPPSHAVPKLAADAAWRSAREHTACPRNSGGPSIFLAVADVRDSIDTLVYVLRWEDVRWAPSGPPQRVGSPPRPDASGPCIVLIDAMTGASLGSMYMSADSASTELDASRRNPAGR